MARARLIDLTRSLRRAGRIATGIDRVEHAYLGRFLSDTEPVFGIVRTPFGYLLLDRAGLEAVRDRLDGLVPWGGVSLMSRLAPGRDEIALRAESDARQLAIARVSRRGLRRMLRAHLDGAVDYFNVGHSDLTDRVLDAVDGIGGAIHVMIHDVIPLEHPEYQRKGAARRFEKKLRRVGARAHRIIYNSADTRSRAERHLESWGRVPDGIVAHLGTITLQADATALPVGLPPRGPYFVTVGTIEPRKNHAFLLDLWDDWGQDAPPLLICGSRGWNNEEVFARLDALPPDGAVRELPGLDDAGLAALIEKSSGVLFPSVAEGFGLPPVEALSLGARVLCNDLNVFREILGKNPVYVDVSDPKMWKNTLMRWANEPPDAPEEHRYSGSTWDDHFKTVLSLM
ncbi:glycosyltransferase family 4 protein [Sulfitobacter aestuariivivens]|uniref:Glycosyltransferase family 4 protein n=2 Tax=Sulfitobacter aestuariivivens TaxID=2766981 RepID=A0A927D504_9RHOB|nr:glycosyltransferase family 4 protein [Sulfitobacter aestuariivivens]